MAEAAGKGDVAAPAKLVIGKPADAKRVSEAHLKLVDERDGPRGVFQAVREVTSAAVAKVTFSEQSESARPPKPVEDKHEAKRSEAATRNEELRKMLRQQQLETRSILEASEQWMEDDDVRVETGAGVRGVDWEGGVATGPPIHREAPTANFTPLWGVHADPRRVRAARTMLVRPSLLCLRLI